MNFASEIQVPFSFVMNVNIKEAHFNFFLALGVLGPPAFPSDMQLLAPRVSKVHVVLASYKLDNSWVPEFHYYPFDVRSRCSTADPRGIYYWSYRLGEPKWGYNILMPIEIKAPS